MQLEGKTAIVTGASRGIGEATAECLSRAGANVVLAARSGGALAAVRDRIRQAGGAAEALAGDVRDESYAQALVELAEDRFGGLDMAFNNAGMLGAMIPAPEMAEADWAVVLATNLTGAFLGAKHQIPAIARRGGGSVLFCSSFVGHALGMPGMAAYGAAKAGLVGLARCLAVEHGRAGVRVNALLPGAARTDMAAEFGTDAETRSFVREMHALKRIAESGEIAEAALFLLSDAAAFVTGTAFLADGGNSVCKT